MRTRNTASTIQFWMVLAALVLSSTAWSAPKRHAGLDAKALARLKTKAKAEHSTALVVFHKGKPIVQEYFGADPETAVMAMSVTKSVAALGIGIMVDKGMLSLDTPLSKGVIPEWAGGDHAGITLRQLLAHTSGIDQGRYGLGKPPKWSTGTIEAHVVGGALKTPPGEAFAYNNNAVDFLSVIARRAHPEGMYFDDFLQHQLFGPLGVIGAFWSKDGRGDARAAGELLIRPMDLAKIGLLVLQRGKWQGKQLVSEAWIDEMLAPGQKITDQCGLLWWRDGRPKAYTMNAARLERWGKAGVKAETVEKASTLIGKRFTDFDVAKASLKARIGDTEFDLVARTLEANRTRMFEFETEPLAWRADGWLGQYVIVVPGADLVAVRMRDPRRTSWKADEYSYTDFRWDVLEVAGIKVPKAMR
ncbi:MAG: serine hydrolase domain-containing protein [Bradymonadia bacterium]